MECVVLRIQSLMEGRYEHFSHQADIGVRGIGATKEQAFEQAALALTAVITDVNSIEPRRRVSVICEAPSDELLLVDWLNAIIYEIATKKILFSRFEVHIDAGKLSGSLWGQDVDVVKHEPAVEIKGATYTELKVCRDNQGRWIAQCVVDV